MQMAERNATTSGCHICPRSLVSCTSLVMRGMQRKEQHSREEKTMTVEDNKKNDEAAIKRVIERYVEALRAKDLDGIMPMVARQEGLLPPARLQNWT
jgi:hypothetical protein